jgi:lysophospholipase
MKFFSLILVLLTGLLTMTLANGQNTNFTQEPQLSSRLANEIANFWQTGSFSHFQGVDNKRIAYAAFINNENIESIVVVSGRSEGYLKYKELAYDLFQQGYNIYMMDNRGQGISERLTSDPHKGYVKNFDDYAEDLNQFITLVAQENTHKRTQKKPHILAHSMGGAIATRMMQLYPDRIQSAILSSPMIAIESGGLPTWLAKSLIYSTDTINNWVAEQPWYFIGQTGFSSTAFTDNQLSHSAIRYQQFVDLYQSNKTIQLGGVTVHWLRESLRANENIFSDLSKLTTPILLLQAGNDEIVDNQAQTDFCQQLHQIHSQSCPNGKPMVFDGAYHELFFELDQYRNPALTASLEWFALHK